MCGYTTVYQYYAYPQNTRPRISQMLVLPPFQRKGLGAEMLDVVQARYATNEKVVDITGRTRKVCSYCRKDLLSNLPQLA